MHINRFPVASPSFAAPGDVARQMGAAPAAPARTRDAAKLNRYDGISTDDKGVKINKDGIFSAVLFKAADSARVYKNERSNALSKKIANVQVEIRGSGVFVKGSIYARQAKGSNKSTAEFAWFGANMQTCIAVEDETASAELSTFKTMLAKQYATWLRDNPAIADAVNDGAVELDGMTLSEE